MGYAAALGLDADEAMEHLPKIIHDKHANYIVSDRDGFRKKFGKIRQNLRFIEDDYFDMEKYRAHISRKAV